MRRDRFDATLKHMPLNTKLSDGLVDAQADVVGQMLRDGFVDILTGPQPETYDTPIAAQILLVSMRLSTFARAVSGVITAESPAEGVAIASGDCAWFRAYRSDHKTAVLDGSAGKTNSNLILGVKTIVEGLRVSCGYFSHVVSRSSSGR